MKALVAIHLPENGYDDIKRKIKLLAKQHLDDGNLVFQLFDHCNCYDIGLGGVETIPDTNPCSAIDQILRLKERLKEGNVQEADLCGIYRYLCVQGVGEQLAKRIIDYPHKGYEDRVRKLDDYKVKVNFLEEICIK